MHDLLQTYFEFNHLVQSVNMDVINDARMQLGIRDVQDYGFNADPICTSVYDSFLRLMISGHITKQVNSGSSMNKPVEEVKRNKGRNEEREKTRSRSREKNGDGRSRSKEHRGRHTERGRGTDICRDRGREERERETRRDERRRGEKMGRCV